MSVEKTLQERGARYGDFTDHAYIAQSIQDVMRSSVTNWDTLNPVKKQALTVIADKIARILSGDPNYADNWHDIQGYAKLVEDRLPKEVCLNNTQILRATRTTEEEQVQGLQGWICRHNTLGGIRYPSWEIAARSCEACKRMQQNG